MLVFVVKTTVLNQEYTSLMAVVAMALYLYSYSHVSYEFRDYTPHRQTWVSHDNLPAVCYVDVQFYCMYGIHCFVCLSAVCVLPVSVSFLCPGLSSRSV